MPLLRILSTRPQAGKTTAAVALAQGLSLAGARVSLTRAGDGDAAHQDAATFATYAFASSPGRPVEPAAVTTAAAEIAISEAGAATSPADAAAVIVVRAAPDNADRDLGRALGEHLIGTIATCVVPARRRGRRSRPH